MKSAMMILFVSCVAAVLSLPAVLSAPTTVYVTWDSNTNEFTPSMTKGDNIAAEGTFENTINSTGWTYLRVVTNPFLPDWVQAYAAGLAEARLTSDLISLTDRNTNEGFCPKPYSELCLRLKKFLDDNIAYAKDNFHNPDSFWYQFYLYLVQIMGIQDAFENQGQVSYSRHEKEVDIHTFGIVYLMQVGGDIEDLMEALKDPSERTDKISAPGPGHCSGLIKLTEGYQELFSSQVTWSHLNTMLRVLKMYELNFRVNATSEEKIPGYQQGFSSYPAVTSSGDDFYVLSSGLMSLETTIGNYNDNLWKFVTPEAVLEAARVTVANRLAVTSKGWTDIFAARNSGTYNNQYVIVDYKMFVPGGTRAPPGMVYVTEQIPGLVASEDITERLYSDGFFGSYNIAYNDVIWKEAGFGDLVEKWGDWWDYEEHPRAKIYRRDHGKVKDLPSMMALMRYNDFTKDPLARCDCNPPYSAENAVSARSDLNLPNGTYPFPALSFHGHAGIDAKVTSFELFRKMSFSAVGGPTYTDVPAFQWSNTNVNMSHFGMPDLWKFEPILFGSESFP